MTDEGGILDRLWYAATPSRAVAPGHMSRVMLFDEPIVVIRENTGAVHAMRDVCPHRAAPLSEGRLTSVDGVASVACPYHGWRFRLSDGGCALIPALSSNAEFDASKISVKRFAAKDAHGVIWICPTVDATPDDQLTDLGLPLTQSPNSITIVEADGPYDEAVIGLVDPAHTPFVHKQWWWRDGKPLVEKTKDFEPTRYGFRMPPHAPSSNSRIYGLLGGAPTTEIEFRLPGLRIETIRNRKSVIVSATAISPIAANRSRILHLIYWDAPWLHALTPIVNRMARNFLSQDGAILDAQARNLNTSSHRPLYAGDPDVPAQWYHALKRAWRASASDGAFENPLTRQTLHWRT